MLNQFNSYIYWVGLSGLQIAILVLNQAGTVEVPSWLQLFLLTNTVLFLSFGLLTLHTRPDRLVNAKRKAERQAIPILQNIFREYTMDGGGEVRVVEIVQNVKSPALAEEDIYRLYDLVPACFLPNQLHDKGPMIDWHRYDLCIISAAQDLKLARRIERALRVPYPKLRVFVDDGLVISPQGELFKRIYRAGSHLCLALISAHFTLDLRCKHQLNEARHREKISKNRMLSSRAASYLKPIALDEHGLQFMMKHKDLALFVEHVSIINDRDTLFTLIVNSIQEELGRLLPFPPVAATQTNTQHHLADAQRVFISHASDNDAFAWPLYRDLGVRGISCWFAPEDMRIGQKIRDAIERALRQHRRVVLVLSEESIKSSWVEFEVELAFEMEKESNKTLLYPIKIDNAIDTASSAWARMLRRQVHIGNFANWGNAEAYNKALERLIEALQLEKPSDESIS